MTIPTNTGRNDYVGSGITGPYPVTWKFFDNADLLVTVDGVAKTLTTDYTVTGAGEQAGGSLTFVSAVTAGSKIAIEPRWNGTQDTDIRNDGGNLRVSIEDRLDRQCRDDQVLKGLVDRSLKVRTNDASTVSTVLEAPVGGSLLGWNQAGTAIVNTTSGNLATDSFQGEVVSDIFEDGSNYTAGTTTTLTLSVCPYGKTNTTVTFDGVVQHTDTYEVVDAVVTFDAAIPSGVDVVEVKTVKFVAIVGTSRRVFVQDTEPTEANEGDEWIRVTTGLTSWGDPTGTATRTAFATNTVTLEQLAQRVKALIDDLKTTQLLGS
jgi:hypothetical protein